MANNRFNKQVSPKGYKKGGMVPNKKYIKKVAKQLRKK